MGKYESKDLSSQTIERYEFIDCHHFELTSTELFGHQRFVRKGYHFLIQDTLLLVFDSTGAQNNRSEYDITDTDNKMENSFSKVILSIANPIGEKMIGATVVLKDLNDEIVAIQIADENGACQINSESQFVKSIEVYQVGHYSAKIPYTPEKGNRVQVNVRLKPIPSTTIIHKYGIEKYLVKSENLRGKEIELISLVTGNTKTLVYTPD